jgi:hypothetical protein
MPTVRGMLPYVLGTLLATVHVQDDSLGELPSLQDPFSPPLS